MANAEDRRPRVDSEGIVGTGPTYGEHSFNGRPDPEGKPELGLFDEGQENNEDKLKEKVRSLIKKGYEYARALSDANFVSQTSAQFSKVESQIEMAKELGLITDEEDQEIRSKIFKPRIYIPESRKNK